MWLHRQRPGSDPGLVRVAGLGSGRSHAIAQIIGIAGPEKIHLCIAEAPSQSAHIKLKFISNTAFTVAECADLGQRMPRLIRRLEGVALAPDI